MAGNLEKSRLQPTKSMVVSRVMMAQVCERYETHSYYLFLYRVA